MRQPREDIEAQMKLGCVNMVCRKDVKQMEQINCESVLWAASSSVCSAKNRVHNDNLITCNVTWEQSHCHWVLLL